ncbi:hypothetical protein F5884DRAFT_870186 [Xylogone sp. PMI_703]|nr:hypothetical protein F5884DRAFT_870186 [Xylogone sp. PMI_703]
MELNLREFSTEISGNRQKGHELTLKQRAAICAAVISGQTHWSIVEAFCVSRSTVTKCF